MEDYEKEILKMFFAENLEWTVEVGKFFESLDQQSVALITKAMNKWKKERDVEPTFNELVEVLIEAAEERGAILYVDDRGEADMLLIDALSSIIRGLQKVQEYVRIKNV